MIFKFLTKTHFGIRRIFALFLAFTLLAVVGILTAYSISLQRKILLEGLTKRGSILVKNLAGASTLSILRGDNRQLRELVFSLSDDQEVLYAEIFGKQGEVLARIGDEEKIQRIKPSMLLQIKTLSIRELSEQKIYDFYYPIMVRGHDDDDSRNILMGIPTEDTDESIERMIGIAHLGLSTEFINKQLSGIAVRGIILAVFILIIIGLILNYLINVHIVQPLRKLTLAAVTASHGDLRQEVDIQSNNEIGVLARAFNLMIHDLREFQIKLEQSIYKLEDKVKERTQQLEKVMKELSGTNKEMREKDQIKSNFINLVSRELRSPITTIQGYAETLAYKGETLNKDKKINYLHAIERESDRISLVLQYLVTLTRLEAGELTVQWESIDPGKIIKEIIQIIDDKFDAVTFSITGTTYKKMDGDEALVKTVMYELIY
ncbi:MAG: HAMP domain-containing protein, partial [Elusimicrobia bacterium]|nr:HAMP domain-containing protein [Elusimicrobiota bacterium]MBD3411782.1 HAMP domain-containing protein [Elusimicrobiota bacterium]